MILIPYTTGSTRLTGFPGSHEVVYARKGGHDEPELIEDERIGAMDFTGQTHAVRLRLTPSPEPACVVTVSTSRLVRVIAAAGIAGCGPRHPDGSNALSGLP